MVWMVSVCVCGGEAPARRQREGGGGGVVVLQDGGQDRANHLSRAGQGKAKCVAGSVSICSSLGEAGAVLDAARSLAAVLAACGLCGFRRGLSAGAGCGGAGPQAACAVCALCLPSPLRQRVSGLKNSKTKQNENIARRPRCARGESGNGSPLPQTGAAASCRCCGGGQRWPGPGGPWQSAPWCGRGSQRYPQGPWCLHHKHDKHDKHEKGSQPEVGRAPLRLLPPSKHPQA